MSMTIIETKTLVSSQTSIEFTSIPQDGTDLLVMLSTRGSRSDEAFDNMEVTFNNVTSGYSEMILYGVGSGSAGALGTSGASFVFTAYSSSSLTNANTFSNAQIYIPNYSGATNKSVITDSVIENNATATFINLQSGLWSNTAAITSIKFTASTFGPFLTGSAISLYKITKGSSGGVVVS